MPAGETIPSFEYIGRDLQRPHVERLVAEQIFGRHRLSDLFRVAFSSHFSALWKALTTRCTVFGSSR